MLPRELKPENFLGYPPEAKKLATEYVETWQTLPLSFLSSLVREVVEYDFKFPAERRRLERELETLRSLSASERAEWFQEFTAIRLSAKLEHLDWVKSPGQFVEQLSAHLWTTHQQDRFRQAAIDYADRLHARVPPEEPRVPRLGISVIGQGVEAYAGPLFRKLRPHGAHFTGIDPANGLEILLRAVSQRAKAHPAPYGHWYIDGGEPAGHDPNLTTVSYAALEEARSRLLGRMQEESSRPGMGPEALRTTMAEMKPRDVGLDPSVDSVLSHFELKLLTEGSGTQVFSTTFVQWAARETLRRAEPLSLIVRFRPRQRQKPMNELLSASSRAGELDFVGSLVDGDMGAYYNWVNQQRLPGAEKSSFLAWFEGHNEAVAIGPGVPRATESTAPSTVNQLLSWII